MKLSLGLCAAAALYALVAPAGQAQDTASFGYSHGFGETQHYNVCTADYAKFCGDVSKYGMRQCLLDHQFEYSAACKELRRQEAEHARDAVENVQSSGSSYNSQSDPSRSYLSGR